jgi:filamentous hemagglutinin family protein
MKLARLILLASTSISSIAAANNPAVVTPPDPAPTIVAGGATFNTDATGTVRTVTQTTAKAFLDWTSLNVPQDHTLRFEQPDAAAIALNRVTGTSGSFIDGLIEANGQVWILNPNGVFISPTGRITTRGFLASTGNISDTDFMNDTSQFIIQNSGSSASIVNHGSIISDLGYTILNASAVLNGGEISANRGAVLLASADNMGISFDEGRLISYSLNNNFFSSTLRDITNTGTITADGGLIAMSLASALGAISGVINVDGLIEAKSIGSENGTIVLDAGPNGALSVKGTVTVEGAQTGEVGGIITAQGSLVAIEPEARLNADGKAGGGAISISAIPAAQTDISFLPFLSGSPSTSTFIQSLLQQRERLANGSLASVAIKQGSLISASATEDGLGGLLSVEADGALGLSAKIAGQLFANGAGAAGHGGSIDLSAFYLDIQGANLKATGGAPTAQAGTVNLTAGSIDIVSEITSTAESNILRWQSSGNLDFYNIDDLQSINLSDLQVSGRIPIGFDFLYFGETFDTIEVTYSGVLSFGRLNGNPLCCDGLPLDGLRTPPAIFGLWTDLGIEFEAVTGARRTPSGRPRFGTFTLPDGTKEFVVQWHEVPEFGFFNGPPNTFEIRLRENGEIILNFGDLSISNHDVTAGLIGRTINDAEQLFNVTRSFNSNILEDFSNTSSIFVQPNPVSEIRAQDVANILDNGTSVSIRARDFTAANGANQTIGNITVSAPSLLDLSRGGPTREFSLIADKTILINETQDFGLNGFEVRLRADANLDGTGHIQSYADILGADLIAIDGLLIVSSPIQLSSSGDISLSKSMILEDVAQVRLDAGGSITVNGSISGSSGLTILNAADGINIADNINLLPSASASAPQVALLNTAGDLSVGGSILSEDGQVLLRSNNLNVGSILVGSAGTIDLDVSGSGDLANAIKAFSLSNSGPGTVTLSGGSTDVFTIRLAGGTISTTDALGIGAANLLFDQGRISFTTPDPVTLNNQIFIQQFGEVSFSGSGTIAGAANGLSQGIGVLKVKAGEDLTFAGEIGTSHLLNAIFGIAEGRVVLGVDAKLAASNLIELAGFGGFSNLSTSAEVLAAPQWFVWSGNPNPFDGSTPDITGALQHDWRLYGISEAMIRGDAPPPARPNGANGLGYSLAPVLTPQAIGTLSKLYDGSKAFSVDQVSLVFGGSLMEISLALPASPVSKPTWLEFQRQPVRFPE